jgi:hypothetical protein
MKISPYSDVSFEQTTSAPNQRIKHIILQLATVTLMTIGSGLLVNLCLRYDMLYGDHTLGEVSLTECVQQILLGITVIAFYRIRSQRQDLRHSALLIAGFFLVLFIRELDFLFDKIAHGFWVYPALAVTCAAIIFAISGKQQTWYSFGTICRAPNMRLLVMSLMLLLVFSRLFGEANFWKLVMQDGYMRVVKNTVEEGIELLCYALMAISAVSCQLYLKKTTVNTE